MATTIYTVDPDGQGGHLVHKLDDDLSPLATYHVSRAGGCDCLARGECRHQEMVDLFESEGLAGQNRLLDYDHWQWVSNPVGDWHADEVS